mmetsp:Transcript_119876/g.284840  ORF Transcript_119876/g.284840 Transcript_119876/m.284840 type:complete len:83 (+) Transcript_119876:1001-1249(+)
MPGATTWCPLAQSAASESKAPAEWLRATSVRGKLNRSLSKVWLDRNSCNKEYTKYTTWMAIVHTNSGENRDSLAEKFNIGTL